VAKVADAQICVLAGESGLTPSPEQQPTSAVPAITANPFR